MVLRTQYLMKAVVALGAAAGASYVVFWWLIASVFFAEPCDFASPVGCGAHEDPRTTLTFQGIAAVGSVSLLASVWLGCRVAFKRAGRVPFVLVSVIALASGAAWLAMVFA